MVPLGLVAWKGKVVDSLWRLAGWLVVLAILIASSGFFSACEAILFSLKATDVQRLRRASPAGRVAADLLDDPSRLLSAVLFWNLLINICYFTVVSVIAIMLEKEAMLPRHMVVAFPFAALLGMIFLSEMVPKSLGVLAGSALAPWIGIPLAVTIRVLDPLMPSMRLTNTLSRRLFCPQIGAEPYLEIGDLERAIRRSSHDAQLQEQERHVLQQLVGLSDLRVDEWMRPRSQLTILQPPVNRNDWGFAIPPGGYLLVTEGADSNEIGWALNLDEAQGRLADRHIEHQCEPVVYVPWCCSVADAFELLMNTEREVAAVVTEFGETIGVLTMEDIFETLFTSRGGRSERLFHTSPISRIGHDVWRVHGMMNLRRLADYFSCAAPTSRGVTVAGWLEEYLERMPQPGDRAEWEDMVLEVAEAPSNAPLVIHLRKTGDPPPEQPTTPVPPPNEQLASNGSDDEGKPRSETSRRDEDEMREENR